MAQGDSAIERVMEDSVQGPSQVIGRAGIENCALIVDDYWYEEEMKSLKMMP